MKLTKDFLKKVIKEEVEKVIEEQSTSKDAFASVKGLADKMVAATGANDIDLGTQTIRARRPRRPNKQIVKLQKTLGVKGDGIIGPKTVAAYNRVVKPTNPITIPQLKKLMKAPESSAMIVSAASELARKAAATVAPAAQAVATGAGPKSDKKASAPEKIAPEYEKAIQDLENLGDLEDSDYFEDSDDIKNLEEQFKKFL